VEKVEAGPKGMVIGFRGNQFRNPAGLIAWLSTRKGTIRLRPDHKLSVVREMGVAERMSLGRDVLSNLNRIAAQVAKAA
jgi:transcription-repair coupling factor (superfamily II helicase)